LDSKNAGGFVAGERVQEVLEVEDSCRDDAENYRREIGYK
jgi:hypothetical protein